jgi:bifunctional NMN adenylyltransferase/nudix hydrolase
MKFDALVFIGRFQPFHNGHKAIVDVALTQAKEVIIVVGSSFASRNIRNPFTFQERKAMIEACFTESQHFTYEGAQGRVKIPRVKVVPVADYPYDDNKWVNAVRNVVHGALKWSADPLRIGLIGHEKDGSSFYLKIFPTWDSVAVPNVDGINATDIRKALFASAPDSSTILPTIVHKIYEQFVHKTMNKQAVETMHSLIIKDGVVSPWFETLFQEYQMVKKYKEAWKVAPFPPTFVTVDAVVVQSGHILLVKRGAMPGKGLWALPGGFLNQEETLLDGAIRELKEETKIKVPVPVLKGSIKDSKTFDHPNRSSRGRTITTAFYIDLGFGEELPKVKGSDDAQDARWVPFNEVDREQMFEDHFAILDNFINIG